MSEEEEAAGSGTKETAKEEAVQVKDTAADAGREVADVAQDEAGSVVAEAGQQAKNLVRQTFDEVSSQAGQQQLRIAEALQSLAKELGAMASASSEDGPMTNLARQGSEKGGEIGHWLETREPRDVLREVKSFARRRPGTFLLGAAVAGIAVGRLTRGMAAEAKDDHTSNHAPAKMTAESASVSDQPARSLVDEVPTQDDGTGQRGVWSEENAGSTGVPPAVAWPPTTGRDMP